MLSRQRNRTQFNAQTIEARRSDRSRLKQYVQVPLRAVGRVVARAQTLVDKIKRAGDAPATVAFVLGLETIRDQMHFYNRGLSDEIIRHKLHRRYSPTNK